jgi:hypothetical protein
MARSTLWVRLAAHLTIPNQPAEIVDMGLNIRKNYSRSLVPFVPTIPLSKFSNWTA